MDATNHGAFTSYHFEPGTTAASTPSEAWPELAPDALHGLAGEVVRAISPHTESDPVALLIQFLVSFGNAVGRKPYYMVESDRHYGNLFGVLVGPTAKGRKGTAAGRVRDIMERVDADWADQCIKSGLSSGEGVIWCIRDPIYKIKKGQRELEDKGVADKRLMLDEREFFGALSVMRREGNILSRILRDLWDNRRTAETLTKNNPAKATEPYVSIIGHITDDELRQNLDHTSFLNGFANRFVFTMVRRSKLLPHGGCDLEDSIKDCIAASIRLAVNAARKLNQVTMTEAAQRVWEAIYAQLSEGKPGLLGAACGRAEAQTIRFALIYALLDGVDQIDVVHLRAAIALWDFCERSARRIFGDLTGERVQDAILLNLRNAGEAGMTRTEISNLFGRNVSQSKIISALSALAVAGKAAKFTNSNGPGRPTETWKATKVSS
jgi:hypothetical protein